MDSDNESLHSDDCIVRAIFQATYDHDVVYCKTEEGVKKVFKREPIPAIYRSMLIVRHMWKKVTRESMDKEIEWAVNSCRTIGVQQGKYLAVVVCSAKVWLLRTYNRVTTSFGWNPKIDKTPSLESVCMELMETLLEVKNMWHAEVKKLARDFPSAVFTAPIPLKSLALPRGNDPPEGPPWE